MIRSVLVCLAIAMLSLEDRHAFLRAEPSIPVVPGLVGFGVNTPAGSGRHENVPDTKVFKVTNLDASGQGSLQECIYASGPRTCVFEVSGVIDLTGDKSYDGSAVINLKNPYITIAGQTAPSPGITIKGKTLRIEAHDVLIQHLRFRVGDSTDVSISPDVRDTILIAGSHKSASRTPHNIVIDHCSISWAIDEVVSVKDTSHHITLSNNIISEGLDRSLHPKGEHSKGLMAVGNYQTIYRNLFAHLRDRAPLDVSPNSVIVNNLSYNTKYANIWSLSRSAHYAKKNYSRALDLVANLRVRGKNTSDRGQNIYAKASENLSEKTNFYVSGNRCTNHLNTLVECGVLNGDGLRREMPLNLDSNMNIWSASKLKEKLLLNVGARPLDRDEIDRRIVNDVYTDSGQTPDCVGQGDIAYPVGRLLNVSAMAVSFKLPRCYESRFEGQEIRVVQTNGDLKTGRITEHKCHLHGVNQLTVSGFATASLSEGLEYRVINSCSNNAGGWPDSSMRRRPLELPPNPNIVSRSGYTRLEEYLHKMAYALEVGHH